MRCLDGVAACQVGNGAGHLQAAVGAATAPPQPGGGFLQQGAGAVVQPGLGVDGLAVQVGIGASLAVQGALAGHQTAGRNGEGAFPWRGVQQVLRGQTGHLDVQVDPVQQGAAEFALVAADLVG